MKMKTKFAFLCLLPLLSCDRSGDDLVPQPNGNYDAVIEIGNLEVINFAQVQELQVDSNPADWCTDSTGLTEEGAPLCYYGIVGQAEAGVKGGATFTFKGNGSPVCVIVDPETVFWNASLAVTNPNPEFAYRDLEEDDGDMDLFAGLSSYYTGSPGVDIGDFKGYYTDSLGSQVEIEYGECFQYGAQSGMNNAHAGRAGPEYCTVNTENREGVEYTVVLESFSIPLNDGALGFGTMVLEGACTDYAIDECLLPGESLIGESDAPKIRDCTLEMETAACTGQLLSYCCIHPEMCGEDAETDDCNLALEYFLETDGISVDSMAEFETEYCAIHPEICCSDPIE
jgi:hypothetical protein